MPKFFSFLLLVLVFLATPIKALVHTPNGLFDESKLLAVEVRFPIESEQEKTGHLLVIEPNQPAKTFVVGGSGLDRIPKVFDKEGWAILSAMVGSAIFDLETTFAAINKPGVYEASPLMKDLMGAGRLPAYGFALGTTGLGFWGYAKMKTSKNPLPRKLRFIPPLIPIMAHIVAGGMNLRFVF